MKIIVTGVCGFIGYHLAKNLLINGNEVLGIDNFSDYYDLSLKKARLNSLKFRKFKFIEADINNLSFKVDGYDLAINLAAQPGVRLEKEKEYLYKHNNINGFQNFCLFCDANNIKRILYASSSSVYSDSDEKKFNEKTTRLNPKSQYGKSKLENEKFASSFSKETASTMIGLRFFSVYGPWGRPDMAYYSFTESLKKNTELTLYDHGAMARDMTYIDDIIDGISGAIDHINSKSLSQIHDIFNLGNNHPIKTSYLLDTLEKQLGMKAQLTHKKSHNESNFTHADIEKAADMLNYRPKINFENGIQKFLQWHKEYQKI